MSLDTADLASRANALVSDSPDREYPALSSDSDLEMLRAWLSACDPDGSWDDADRVAQGFSPLGLEDAWGDVNDILIDCEG
jgi:hypothetical protein